MLLVFMIIVRIAFQQNGHVFAIVFDIAFTVSLFFGF